MLLVATTSQRLKLTIDTNRSTYFSLIKMPHLSKRFGHVKAISFFCIIKTFKKQKFALSNDHDYLGLVKSFRLQKQRKERQGENSVFFRYYPLQFRLTSYCVSEPPFQAVIHDCQRDGHGQYNQWP